MPHDGRPRPHGAARAAAEPRGTPAGDQAAPHVRGDPGDPRAVRSGERRHRQADVRARQGSPARLRGPPGAGRRRRLGLRAGVPDPQGQVLPPGDRLHRRGDGCPAGGRTERGRELRGRGGRPEAGLRRGRRCVWRASRADRSHRDRTPAAPSSWPWRDAVDGNRRVRFGYRTSQGQASEREVDAFAMVYRGGHWYLVGHDTDRDDIRAFRLSRFTGEPARPRGGEADPSGLPSRRSRRGGAVGGGVRGSCAGGVRARSRLVGRRRIGGRRGRRHARRRVDGVRDPDGG